MDKLFQSALKKIKEAREKKYLSLDISNHELEFLPKELFDLTWLNELILSNNRLKSLPKDIYRFRELRKLYLSKNELKSLPEEFVKLDKLTHLSISRNRLTNLPKDILHLKKLEMLNIEGNYLISLPFEIGNLRALKRLFVGENKINSLPSEIGNLFNLERLYLNKNHLVELPSTITSLKKLKVYYFNDNPLRIPPIEIANRELDDIRNYFLSLMESESNVELKEAKLLIVGEGGVGKTCLKNKLVHDYLDLADITTEGIDIDRWDIVDSKKSNFRINVWDFGGQEIYHSTHQFFLTKRSLYLFVWEARREDNLIRFDYWLNVIKLLGSDSPVVIVLNKIDERIRMIDEEVLVRRFPNIVKFHHVSSLNGDGITDLRKTIKKEINKLPHIGDYLPDVWHKIRKKLENLKINSISLDYYLTICQKYDLNEEKAIYLSRYLHDLGIFLHFQDNQILKDVIFLKPEWATNAVYKILDTKEILMNYGKFHFNELINIWDDYPRGKHVQLLELMKKFELCFQLPENNFYIVPELLPVQKPNFKWDYENSLKFEYRYDFMPSGIIARFIVLTHHIMHQNIYWKNGVMLQYEDSHALIISEQLNRKINIWVNGNHSIELLSVIREKINYIHMTLNYPEVKEMIPCNCSECIFDNSPQYHDFAAIRKALKRGKISLECQKSFNYIDIRNLLGALNPIITENEQLVDRDDSEFRVGVINVVGQANFAEKIGKINKKE